MNFFDGRPRAAVGCPWDLGRGASGATPPPGRIWPLRPAGRKAVGFAGDTKFAAGFHVSRASCAAKEKQRVMLNSVEA